MQAINAVPVLTQVTNPIKVECRLIGEVYEELRERLKAEGKLPEYFGLWYSGDRNFCFPKHIWLSCYCVSHSIKNWYIHVEAVTKDKGKRYPLFLGKTYRGIDFAYEVAKTCAKHLGA
ncbi:MAG: hypothetical protein HPY90_11795 [Syntrophothermus sp.]|uniref:hypothetical protein n=1 Tax=Syntrophothermus sp. TaxID=2736299 RepID=UPI0025797DD1|nr:hypothetical protein [Syntrophothermus sp.]NSW83930.1 hypothetical protein [Syntrophothermus sp.]